MNEELEAWREVEVNDVLHKRNINTTSRQVGNDQIVHLFLAEKSEALLSSLLVHHTEDERCLQLRLPADLMQILDVMPCCGEYNRLVLAVVEVNELLHDVKKCTSLVNRARGKELALQVVGKLGLAVDLNHLVIFDATQGEVLHTVGDCRREEQALAILRHFLRNLIQLLREAHLEEAVSLVINDELDLGQLQVGLLDAMHETARRRNNDVWVEQQPLELVLHVITTSDEHKGEVGLLRDRLEVHCSLDSDLSRR